MIEERLDFLDDTLHGPGVDVPACLAPSELIIKKLLEQFYIEGSKCLIHWLNR